jgi:DNA repair protein RecN (Recombination protein N)
MLNRIDIHNLVIVRALDLDLVPGMTALTGETGAGKSILIEALGLTLGDKADNNMIRSGASKAEISISFEIAPDSAIAAWLKRHDLASGGECLLRRVLVRDGRSRAYINGTPTPLALLKELGEMLVDIHGQNAHQSLLQPAAQRQLLDEYAGLRKNTRNLALLFQTWRSARDEYEALQKAGEDRASRLDYLRFQIGELQDLVCTPQGLRELEAEQTRLAHAERLLNESGSVLALLSDNDPSLMHSLSQAARTLSGLGVLDPRLGEAREMLETAGIQIEEVASQLRHYQEQVEIDPEKLQRVDRQLGKLHDAARKHRVAPAELSGLLDTLCAEVEGLEQSDKRLLELDGAAQEHESAYFTAAHELSKARLKAAAVLSDIVSNSMQELGMQGGRFEIRCEANADRPAVHGLDRVDFLVAANPGQPMASLADVASGGELSRISLAVQVATVDCAAVPTLIFDEVDVGIGGAVAEIVGQLLRRLGGQRQVLCVTHLPQVASQAHHQLRVQKLSDGKTTETRIDPLDEKARVDEVARMLGGIDITQQTRRHAREMIQSAQKAS